MTIISDFEGTREDSITIGRGDITVVGQDIVALRQNSGILEFMNSGSVWVPVGGGAASAHNSLSGIQGGASGDYFHFTSVQHGALISSGDTTLHYHLSDRSRANHTGTQLAVTISDFQTTVSANTDVSSNTLHRTSTGSDHTYIDQDVTSGSSPIFDASNFTNITDTDAIHDNISGEISAITEKTTPVGTDLVLIEDSADSNSKKRVQIDNLPGGGSSSHNSLSGLQGGTTGEYYHFTMSQHGELIGAGDTTLHYHLSDRSRANHTGTQLSGTISDFQATVSLNTDVSANTVHRTSTGADHSYIDQDVTSGSAPILDASNFTNVTDVNAIHDNVSGEISAVIEKVTPVGTDLVLIEDSADTNSKKKVQLANLPGGGSSSHNSLSGLQGGTTGEYYHLTATQHSELVGAGNTALHYHTSDRDRANHTGTQLAVTISDFQTTVSANTDVAANTVHRTSTGADHTYIDQDVTNGASPVLDASNFTNVTDVDAIHDNVSGEISAVLEKVTPVGTDLILIEDSADTNSKKKVQLTNIPGLVLSPEFPDNTFRVVDDVDNTKKVAFEASGITTSNTRTITVPDYDFDLEKPLVDSILFDTAYVPGTEPASLLWWDSACYTVSMSTGLGPVLQIGQELYVIVYNGTGVQIDNGSAVYPVGSVGGAPSVALANASTHVKILGEVLVTTMDIPAGSRGIATSFGRVRGIDTNAWEVGDTLWVSPDVDGALTNNVKPSFPDYVIQVGGVLVKSETEGEIIVTVKGIPEDTVVNFWNGVFREQFDFRIDSDGVSITGTLVPTNGHPDLTMLFSDGFSMLDTSPGATITLIPGTDANPQTNYVYIRRVSKVLEVSTSDWPVNDEHIKVAEVALRTVAKTQQEGAFRNQNWNDPIESTSTFQGHLSHICEKIRKADAQWESGIEGSVVVDSGPSPDAVYVKTTGGIVYQMHRQSFPLFDMTQYTIDGVSTGSKTFTISDDGDLTSVFPDGRIIRVNNSTGNNGSYTVVSTSYASPPNFEITVAETIPSAVVDGTIGDVVHVTNNPVTSYLETPNLSTETVDATGSNLTNRSFSFVLWGVQNKAGEPQHLMLNLPKGSYNRTAPNQAVNDALNHSIYEIPQQFKGVGFLIARFTFTLNAAGTVWTLYDTEDLRGKLPNSTAGGGAGGTGVTTFLGLTDTPSAYTSQENNLVRVNAGATALEFLDETSDFLSQYALLAGRSTGQELVGGTDSGDDLVLTSTSDATKGNVYVSSLEFAVRDYTDNTKIAEFDLSGITTGNTRSIVTVDGDMTIMSTVDYTDLTDAGETTLHYHSSDRARANHTGTQLAVTISDFQTTVSANTDVTNNTAKISCTTANVDSAGAVMETDYNANTILAANVDNTPLALTVAEQTLVGRITAGNITDLTATQVKTLLSLNNVTNDAQLKRSAGDINTFTTKSTPVAADIVLIEDSADSWNKKKITLTDLLGGGGGVEVYQDSEDAEDSTTATSYVQAWRYTTPTLAIGKYVVHWSCESKDAITRLQINDTITVMESVRISGFTDNEYRPHGGVYFFDNTTSGTKNFDFDYSRINLSYPGYIRRKRVVIVPVTELT